MPFGNLRSPSGRDAIQRKHLSIDRNEKFWIKAKALQSTWFIAPAIYYRNVLRIKARAKKTRERATKGRKRIMLNIYNAGLHFSSRISSFYVYALSISVLFMIQLTEKCIKNSAIFIYSYYSVISRLSAWQAI